MPQQISGYRQRQTRWAVGIGYRMVLQGKKSEDYLRSNGSQAENQNKTGENPVRAPQADRVGKAEIHPTGDPKERRDYTSIPQAGSCR